MMPRVNDGAPKKLRLASRSYSALIALTVFTISSIFTFRTITNTDANISEWHISFARGFTRRGSRGELLELWQFVARLDWGWAESTLRSIPIAILIYLLVRKIGDLARPNSAWVLALFPLGPLYFIYDPGTSGTTDALFLLLVYMILRSARKSTTSGNLIALFILATFVSLVHEGYIFFLPLVLGIAVKLSKGHNSAVVIARIAVAVFLPFLLNTLSRLLATKPDTDFFCELGRGRLGLGSCAPLQLFGEMSVLQAVQYSVSRPPSIGSLLLVVWMVFTFWTVTTLYRASNFSPNLEKAFQNLLPIALVLTALPIFLVGSDWGRWLSIIYTVFLLGYLQSDYRALTKTAMRIFLGGIMLPVISGTGSSIAGSAFWITYAASFLN